MRIAFVYPGYWPYIRRGVERLMHDLASYLVDHGHWVDIITSKPGHGRTGHDNRLTVRYLPWYQHPLTQAYLPMWRYYLFGLASMQVLAREQYDLLHVWTYSYAFGATILRHVRRTPYLFHQIVDDPFFPNGLHRWCYERILVGANQVAALTQYGADVLRARHGIHAAVLPPPVDTRVFQPRATRDLQRPRVLFPGDLGDERKGGLLLLRAWNEVHRRCPQAMLQLAGPFGFAWNPAARMFLATIPSVVTDPAARAAIEILGEGAVADLPTMYANAAVTVLPSVHEAFGMVITESLASGTPVVCSDSAGPGQIIGGDFSIGRTIALRDTPDLFSSRLVMPLAEAILEAIDLARVPTTIERCRGRAAQWDLQHVGAQAEALYSAMLRSSMAGTESTGEIVG